MIRKRKTLQLLLFLRIRTVCWKKQKQKCLWMICSARFRRNLKELPLIVKADVQGSVEAVKNESCEVV